jgi:hypothetical protein
MTMPGLTDNQRRILVEVIRRDGLNVVSAESGLSKNALASLVAGLTKPHKSTIVTALVYLQRTA